MRHRSVSDLMTPTAVSVQRGTTFKEIARLLDEFGVTAVPVVDEKQRPVGVVSEADLLRRHDSGSGANTAVDLMSHPAITAAPGWSAVRAARVMEKHKVKRLPVVDSEGRLIGVLSRSDLLQLFLRRDHAIQEEILEDVLTHTLRLSPSSLTVEVTDGLVTLSGTVIRHSLVPVVMRLCRSVDGVVDVINRLDYEQDDLPVDVRTGTQR
ncbi:MULTISPECIES: CBS domain-containing protein [unclassified Streptomyces]|uniref:CBS domain-containing protein n=1 Tax=unclassified Streptomyces TaxID=2593676 RepID=UPI00224FA614|nr:MULTISPECIES: CBS domain-containing protein [unclassified Streptomyces]WSP53557.1 CBS domain-containing protein [Streptomyces sp. NBC_01241]WSU25775.1 CBS domain-containing protein [Streptomyces sp. NBC_01108]MCX4784943.1 CBS domain-containing protein [Streptomyces sp. NBC_01221]MCX4799104.1 CBS domain-containing protein [Streptomyces sp. NBC_01242]WSJ40301.1 CBS domain-containing protein [Streptomyces sp. NBC_01321]